MTSMMASTAAQAPMRPHGAVSTNPDFTVISGNPRMTVKSGFVLTAPCGRIGACAAVDAIIDVIDEDGPIDLSRQWLDDHRAAEILLDNLGNVSKDLERYSRLSDDEIPSEFRIYMFVQFLLDEVVRRLLRSLELIRTFAPDHDIEESKQATIVAF